MTSLLRATTLIAGLALVGSASFASAEGELPEVAGYVGSGGTLTAALDGSGDAVHLFTTTGTATFTAPAQCGYTVQYLVIGGGGGGGVGKAGNSGSGGGGGGGGGWRTGSFKIRRGESVTITVGAGGAGEMPGEPSSLAFADLPEVIAPGGGEGGSSTGGIGEKGGDGANGGGGSDYGNAMKPQYGNTGGQSTYYEDDGQTIRGFAGGGGAGSNWRGGGGGGAGGPGDGSGNTSGGSGGIGKMFDITGEEKYYCGGGCGSGNDAPQAVGGAGGGGNKNCDGAPNTGGGAGGANGNQTARSGGSGIVILRYTPFSGDLHADVEISEITASAAKFTCTVDLLADVAETCEVKLQIGQLYGPLSAAETLGSAVPLDGTVEKTWLGLLAETVYRYRLEVVSSGGKEYEFTSTFTTGSLNGTGGIVSELADGSLVHLFKNSGTFIVPDGGITDLRYLVIGGGGGGGVGKAASGSDSGGGGGGGGGWRTGTISFVNQSMVTVTVGAGGAGEMPGEPSSLAFADLPEVIAPGGGEGGSSTGGIGEKGGDGANGGGGSDCGNYMNPKNTNGGGQSTYYEDDGQTVRGFAGGGGAGSNWRGGGGGGAGGPGDGSGDGGGGGIGKMFDLTGEEKYYCGGGCGGNADAKAVGGAGGGGNKNCDGAPNTGGGAGGANGNQTARSGGSGVVVLRYLPTRGAAEVEINRVEGGPGFIRARLTVISCGGDESSGALYAAIGEDADHLGDYVLVSAAAEAGDSFTQLFYGLEADGDYLVSVKFVSAERGQVVYRGAMLRTDGATMAVMPEGMEGKVELTDAKTGVVTGSAFVSWGGTSKALVKLKLRYGKESGVYTRAKYLTKTEDIGTITGTARFSAGTWYGVLVAESAVGETVLTEEVVLVSEYLLKAPMVIIR